MLNLSTICRKYMLCTHSIFHQFIFYKLIVFSESWKAIKNYCFYICHYISLQGGVDTDVPADEKGAHYKNVQSNIASADGANGKATVSNGTNYIWRTISISCLCAITIQF